MALIFVTGGAKSGKSKFAEELILKLNDGKQENIWLAQKCLFHGINQFFYRYIHKNDIQCDASFPYVYWSIKDFDIAD